jgi:hypothetical protein
MADAKLTGLSTTSVLVGADLVYVVRDVAGTPDSFGITVTDLFGSIAVHTLYANDNTNDIGASGATRPRTGYFGTSISVGTNPASLGAGRFANNDWLRWRNAANDGNIDGIKVNENNQIAIGGSFKFPVTTGNVIVTDAVHFEINVNTGTKIGTAADQKIGLWGQTPTTQPANIIDADGTLADVTTKFNALLAKLETIGLLASS